MPVTSFILKLLWKPKPIHFYHEGLILGIRAFFAIPFCAGLLRFWPSDYPEPRFIYLLFQNPARKTFMKRIIGFFGTVVGKYEMKVLGFWNTGHPILIWIFQNPGVLNWHWCLFPFMKFIFLLMKKLICLNMRAGFFFDRPEFSTDLHTEKLIRRQIKLWKHTNTLEY